MGATIGPQVQLVAQVAVTGLPAPLTDHRHDRSGRHTGKPSTASQIGMFHGALLPLLKAGEQDAAEEDAVAHRADEETRSWLVGCVFLEWASCGERNRWR